MRGIIETKNLTRSYGKQRGIIDLNFTVREGEVFGFLGPNGAGKTTTIRVLLDFMKPTSGTATIFGLDSHDKDIEIKKEIGYLPGELHLYENMTGEDFLRFNSKFRAHTDWKYIREIAKKLDAELKRTIRKLSHGNKQKIGLIQAFMHKPKLLILDEPTTGLDPLMQHEFYNLLRLAKAAGTTVFFSSHNLPEVEKICDRVAIIREGKIVVVEQIDNLRKRALRPIEVLFNTPLQTNIFKNIPGIKDVVVDGRILRCTVAGSMDKFIKELSKYEVVNITSQEPNLEEIFLTYYSGKGN